MTKTECEELRHKVGQLIGHKFFTHVTHIGTETFIGDRNVLRTYFYIELDGNDKKSLTRTEYETIYSYMCDISAREVEEDED